MMRVLFGVVAALPDVTAEALVTCGDETRRTWFAPMSWGAPGGYPAPTVGERVAVLAGSGRWVALGRVGAGAPTGTPGGGWT